MARFKFGVVVVLVALSWAVEARAQQPWPIVPGQYGGYYLYNGGVLYPRERLPYFALYPPVYYSLPVARTYGYSPFAYPPGYPTPEVACPAAPATIINPYVPQKPAPPVKPTKTTLKPLTIENPFVAGWGEERKGAEDTQVTLK